VVRWGLGAVATAMFALAPKGSALAAEVTGQADKLRTSWYSDERSLAPGQITKARFKRVFNDTLEGQVYAQPLVANGTLLVVTEENWAYGLDPVTGGLRWRDQLGTAVSAGEIPGATIQCKDLVPRVGITGTPVIDSEHNVAYFVSNRYIFGASGGIGWYMHAIELGDGKELPHFPIEIKGAAQNLANVKFEPLQQLQRPALLMMNGVVYAAFGSHCDHRPYEGWIVGVSASSGEVVTKWASSSRGGSIWQSGGGLVSDGPGQILFSTGNGSVEPGVWDPPEGSGKQRPEPEGRLGESVVRVEAQPGGGLATRDYFSPFNSKTLDEKDLDVGSSAPVALPSPYFGNSQIPHLLVQEGKEGSVYLLNRDGLGGRGRESNRAVQELGPHYFPAGVWGTAGVWPGEGGYVDIPSVGPLHFLKYHEQSGKPALSEVGRSAEALAFGSGSPIVTSNGSASGTAVLWITACPQTACKGAEAELRAYNPASTGVAKPFWQEKVGLASKFSCPDASNGHIYVGNGEGHVIGFSGPALTPSSESLELAAPVGATVTRELTLTVTGTELAVSNVTSPTGPFEASGLPKPGARLKPGEVIKVTVAFKPSSRGLASGQFSVVTEAGETKIGLTGSGEAPIRVAAFVTSLEPLLRLTNLEISGSASRLSAHRRKLVISYRLSAAGTVEVRLYRRVTTHRCHRGVKTCFRWVATKLRFKVAGHAGRNVLAVHLGRLPPDRYRLAVIPVNRRGARGHRQTVEFRVSH
jgi:hypothetical protein